MVTIEETHGSSVLGYNAAPSPAPWECAGMCKLAPGAPRIWPHCVPGSSPWWALWRRSAAEIDLEQWQSTGVTTVTTITHTHTAINTMTAFTKEKEEETSLSSLRMWLRPNLFLWFTSISKIQYNGLNNFQKKFKQTNKTLSKCRIKSQFETFGWFSHPKQNSDCKYTIPLGRPA